MLSNKTRSLKNQKIGIFLKGLVHGFGQKYEVCPSFNFCKRVEKNVFLTIFLRKKKSFKDYKNEKLKKRKNWDFSKGFSPWFRSKRLHLAIFLFFAK